MQFFSLLQNFIASKGTPQLALNVLQKHSGVPLSTLRRIAQNEAQPQLANAAAILSCIASRKEATAALAELYPDASKALTEIFTEHTLENNLSPDDLNKLQSHLVARTSCRVSLLCGSRNGTTFAEVEKLMGQEGTQALESLLDDGLVRKSGDRLWLVNGNFSVSNATVLKEQSLRLCEEFNIQNLGSPKALMAVLSESLSDEGLAEVKSTMQAAIAKIVAIRDNPKFQGDRVFFANIQLNTLN